MGVGQCCMTCGGAVGLGKLAARTFYLTRSQLNLGVMWSPHSTRMKALASLLLLAVACSTAEHGVDSSAPIAGKQRAATTLSSLSSSPLSPPHFSLRTLSDTLHSFAV